MTKYTIKKVFEKAFPTNIWKIEIDTLQSLIAVETRDQESTVASFLAFDFAGNCLMSPCKADGKEWTLDSVQNGHLVLKRIGEHTPIQEGIQIIRIRDNEVVFNSYEFVLLDVYHGFVHARHRSISSGESIVVNLITGTYAPASDQQFDYAPNKLQYPIPYPKKPKFLQDEGLTGPLWLSKCGENYLWCYHQEHNGQFDLILSTSDLNQLLDKQVILQQMDKMIPQPYFQIGNQIFFMSYNKQEIVSYLV